MATAETASREVVPRRIAVSQILLWVFGTVLLVGVGIWLLRNAIESPDRFLEVTLIGGTNGTIYALIALGYTLVYGIIELINFAHGDNFMLGTFQTNSIVNEGSFQIPLYPTSFVLGIPLGAAATASSSSGQKIWTIAMCIFWSMLFCMVINVAIERMAYKPLRNQPRLIPLITALGFSYILQDVGLVWKGAGPQPLPNILPTGDIFTWRSADYGWNDFIVVAVTIPVLVVLSYLVRRTRSGKAMRATAQDMDASAMMGINVDRTISFTFALGGALAGAAGAIYALYVGTSKFDLGFRLGLFAFTAAVLGGIGNLTGAVLGGVLLGLIQAYSDGFGDARWTTTVIFTVLILILVFRPSGLLGEQVPEGQ
ncbi:MAG TPA: branched-chain amino acid ABC transporter permease [Gaiellaceae bacterium]|nr:branched-chain amino acid ABC transporter permease [Gaiellaceae bacterium]